MFQIINWEEIPELNINSFETIDKKLNEGYLEVGTVRFVDFFEKSLLDHRSPEIRHNALKYTNGNKRFAIYQYYEDIVFVKFPDYDDEFIDHDLMSAIDRKSKIGWRHASRFLNKFDKVLLKNHCQYLRITKTFHNNLRIPLIVFNGPKNENDIVKVQCECLVDNVRLQMNMGHIGYEILETKYGSISKRRVSSRIASGTKKKAYIGLKEFYFDPRSPLCNQKVSMRIDDSFKFDITVLDSREKEIFSTVFKLKVVSKHSETDSLRFIMSSEIDMTVVPKKVVTEGMLSVFNYIIQTYLGFYIKQD